MDEPKFQMRFIGYDENGKLIGNAPAFKKDEVRMLPLEYAQNPWWKLLDEIPELVVPEMTKKDSVHTEDVYVPPEDPEANSLVEKQNELGQRYHDGELTADQYRELSDKLEKEAEHVELYYCELCKRNHKYTSKIGIAHAPVEDKGNTDPIEEEVIDLPPSEVETTSTDFQGEPLTVKVDPTKGDPDLVKLKAFYRAKTVSELRDIIQELGGEVDYMHRPYEYVNQILELKAEKEA